MSDVDDLSTLIGTRILDCADTDTCGLLRDHYNVSDIVILETATEVAKTILWKYTITPKANHMSETTEGLLPKAE